MLKKGTWTRDMVIALVLGVLAIGAAAWSTGDQSLLWPGLAFYLPPFVVGSVLVNTRNRRGYRDLHRS